jgi:Uma2 family endonuclease
VKRSVALAFPGATAKNTVEFSVSRDALRVEEDMATAARQPIRFKTVADVLSALGDISPSRVRLDVNPGRATVSDLIRLHGNDERLYELVDGFLVEKVVGAKESYLALQLGHFFIVFLNENDLGFVLGADATLRIMPGLVRMPDVSFVSWKQRPDRTIPSEPAPELFPDLAVEILSESNAKAEMVRKRDDYFESGARLVWLINPDKRNATVYTSPTEARIVSESGSLDGGDVLPGFELALKTLFARLEPSKKSKKRAR